MYLCSIIQMLLYRHICSIAKVYLYLYPDQKQFQDSVCNARTLS
jgi:hypothetical protein